ncbi:hypothetical protein [Actinomycetospora callitridis]|uniref:hypothetical protein n=1 Tax=Actinomycetospora callitridis TaxID=913944 RepID=UPI002365B805|nr:hypothetical protein [Actinomycetospora callitridis]MDD7921787.1 hypothetical protein [Actinomycetospora callitridis]
MPPNMAILVHGTVAVLGSAAALATLAGVATASPLMALNTVGFVGSGALSSAAVFYSVALLRIGLNSARKAATTLVAVLAGSAGFMTLVLVLLLTEARFRDEASRFGLHSVAGIGVLVVLVTAVAVTWHER